MALTPIRIPPPANASEQVPGSQPASKYASSLPPWYNSVKQVFDSYGVPTPVWMTIMWQESSGDPTVHGDRTLGAGSWGLFQDYISGGQGAGYTPAQLQDPIFNASVSAPAIAAAFHARPNDMSYITQHSGHPGIVGDSDSRIVSQVNYFNRLQGVSNDLQRWELIATGGYNPSAPVPESEPNAIPGVYMPESSGAPSAADAAALQLGQYNPLEWPGLISGWLGSTIEGAINSQVQRAAQVAVINLGLLALAFILIVAAIFSIAKSSGALEVVKSAAL